MSTLSTKVDEPWKVFCSSEVRDMWLCLSAEQAVIHLLFTTYSLVGLISSASAGDLVKTWRVRYFVLLPGPSPSLTYYRAIEVQYTVCQAACICEALY